MQATVFLVALGGAIGAVLRYWTGLAALRFLGPSFPAGTLVVNVAGSFVMGALAVWLANGASGGRMSPFLMTGILGGFTTFSAFSLDAVTLWDRGLPVQAGVYVGASVVLSVVALVAGMALARSVAT